MAPGAIMSAETTQITAALWPFPFCPSLPPTLKAPEGAVVILALQSQWVPHCESGTKLPEKRIWPYTFISLRDLWNFELKLQTELNTVIWKDHTINRNLQDGARKRDVARKFTEGRGAKEQVVMRENISLSCSPHINKIINIKGFILSECSG